MYEMHQLPIENDNLFPSLDSQPIIIEEIYIKSSNTVNKVEAQKLHERINNGEQPRIVECKGVHLVIFCHGYEGCSYDMKLVKNSLQYFLRSSYFHCARSNDLDTHSSIETLGKNLAVEISEMISQTFNMDIERLSFVGHS
jgi:hypothetical protein